MPTIIPVLRTINLGCANMLRSSVISYNLTRIYMPTGIINIRNNDETHRYTMCVSSQQSELQSISKNAFPFASSVQMYMSINIEIP